MELYGMGKLDDPKAHLLSACNQMFPNQIMYGRGDLGNEIYSHYIFHGVVKYREGSLPDHRYSDTAGTSLARFIRMKKLGKVVGSQPEWNRVNHKDHMVRVWVWTPNPDALKKWFAKNRSKEMIPKPYLKAVQNYTTGLSHLDLVMPILYGEEGYVKTGSWKVIKEKATQADLTAHLAELAKVAA